MNVDAVLYQAHGMWYEDDQDLKPPILVNYTDWHDGPPVTDYPLSASCFPLTVSTNYYKRRLSDGMYGEDDRVATAQSTVSEELVTAMIVGHKACRKFRLRDAMVVAANSCERCLNALGFEYGLTWGYAEGSAAWTASKTRCKMCVEVPTSRIDLSLQKKSV